MIIGPKKVQGGYKPETSEHGDPPTGGSAVRPRIETSTYTLTGNIYDDLPHLHKVPPVYIRQDKMPTGWRTERLGFFERRVPVYDEPIPEPPAPQKRDTLTWLIAALLWGGAIFAMARAAGLPVWNSGWTIDAIDLALLPFGAWNIWFWQGLARKVRQ